MNLLEACRELVRLALKLGAADADAVGLAELGQTVRVRHGSVESVEREDARGLGLRAFVKQRHGFAFASASTADVSSAGMQRLAERVVAMAKVAAVDADAVPPAGAEHPSPAPQGGEIHEAWDLAAAKQAALDCEAAALAFSSDISNSEGAEAGFSSRLISYAAADGFAGSYNKSHIGLGVSVIAGQGEAMQRDYEFAQVPSLQDLPHAAQLGRRAAERACRRLGAAPLASRRCAVVFEPRVAISLLGHLASAIDGRAVLQHRSFLADCAGEAIFPAWVHITDNPAHPKGLGNCPFDGEGVQTRRRDILHAGRLSGFLTDRYAAKRLGIAATGNAKRGLAGDIGIGPHNLLWQGGDLSVDELLHEVGHGIWLTELMGFGVNGVTGDYSRGAAGFLIENGKLTRPLAGITIAGNLKDMFAQVALAANDVTWFGTRAAPTLAIAEMAIAGQP